jgi:ABC-type oligopeptide transport system ATPase subunit
MITVQNLTKEFSVKENLLFGPHKKVRALSDVSFSIPEGLTLGIVGESGSGKTTLAKIIAGFLPPTAGTVSFQGQDLVSLGRKERAPLVQMVFQDPFSSLNPKLVLRTQLREAFNPKSLTISDQAEKLMKDVGLSSEFLYRYPHQLSGGQRQRFAIARALAAEPKLLLADEPVSSLDLSVQAQIINLLNKLKSTRQFSMMVISHDLAIIAHLCDTVIVMKEGEIVEEGATPQILSAPQNPYTQRLLQATPMV